jgi:hypothetical protein
MALMTLPVTAQLVRAIRANPIAGTDGPDESAMTWLHGDNTWLTLLPHW